MKRIAIFLTETQISDLRKLAKTLGVPMAEALRRLLDESLARRRRAARRQEPGH